MNDDYTYCFTKEQLKEFMISLMNAWKLSDDEDTREVYIDRGFQGAEDMLEDQD